MKEHKIIKLLNNKISMYQRVNSPYYYFYFRYNNKTYRGTTKTDSRVESELFCIRKYEEITKKKQKVPSYKSLEECIDYFIEQKRPDIKESTMDGYINGKNFLLKYFKNIDPNTITSNMLDNYRTWRLDYYNNKNNCFYKCRWRNKIKKRSKSFTVSNSTTNHDLSLLVSVLKFCHNKDYITIDKLPHFDKKPEKIRKEILTRNEYLILKDYYVKKNEHYKWSIISFIQSCGCRNNEWYELKWKDINFENKYMTIRNRKQRKDKDKVWTVPIVGTTRKILEELKDRPNIPTGDEDYVFVNNDGKRIQDISRTFKKYLKECGINKPLCIHSLRHTYCSRILSTRPDIPLSFLAFSMGHVSTTQIERTYGHIRTPDVVKFFERSENTKQNIIVERERGKVQNHTNEPQSSPDEPPSYLDLYKQEP